MAESNQQEVLLNNRSRSNSDNDTSTSNSKTDKNKHSLVLDGDVFEDRFLRCSVCRKLFHRANRPPRMLPCHHSFCDCCIARMLACASEQRQTLHALHASAHSMPQLPKPTSAVNITCPNCRAKFVATDYNIKRLPVDQRVLQLIDFARETERCTVTFCSKHRREPIHFFCKPCSRPVCRNCAILDHKEYEGHLVVDLEIVLREHTPAMDLALLEMDSEAACLQEKQVALETVIKTLDNVRVSLLQEVNISMTRLRCLLKEREKVLVGKVQEETRKEKAKLTDNAEVIESRRLMLLELSQRLKQARDDSNIEEMFQVHHEIQQSCNSCRPKCFSEVDDVVLTSITLNIRDEAVLTSRIINFGDVTSNVEKTPVRFTIWKPNLMSPVSHL